MHNEVFDRIVKRQFGATAVYTGAMGSSIEPGTAEIRVDGRPLATGRTFEQAFQRAQATAAALSKNRRRKPETATTE